jgi:hypothetical protein
MTRIDSLEAQSKVLSNVGACAIVLIACFVVCLAPDKAWALQIHNSPEGLYVHQLAHILFAFSMAVLAYWLEINHFTEERGWRLIQISCLLFLLWNLVAFTGHYVEVMIPPDLIEGRAGSWNQKIMIEGDSIAVVYYFLKLDHLVCVPAILCLFFGIRDLYKRTLIAVRDK